MAGTDDAHEVLENLVRLRRLQGPDIASEDVRRLQRFLERLLGPTVKRALAARALGVSQPALDRWIKAGEVPTVPAPNGRWEVPTPALVELICAVEERRRSGARRPLAAVVRERRAAAQRIDVDSLAQTLPRARTGHRGADMRSLAYHRAVAQRLDDRLVRDARERLARWSDTEKIDPRYAERWTNLLARPLPEIARAISRDDQQSRDLRQSSPFAGALSEPERRRVLTAVR